MKRARSHSYTAVPFNHPESDYDYGVRSSGGTHGVVLTKPQIVGLILDLVEYTPDRDLAALRLFEPACGRGAFLIPAAQRLLASALAHNRSPTDLDRAIFAIDVDANHVAESRKQVLSLLVNSGISQQQAQRLVTRWIVRGDSLLEPIESGIDIVVGNPPYVRIEQIPSALQTEYRSRYASLYDRADLYVAFIERALTLLSPQGVLSFICADRWTRNRYGAPLRRMLSESYSVRCYLDFSETSPFDSEVSAYPSIFVVTRRTVPSRNEDAIPVVTMHNATEAECQHALRLCRSSALPQESSSTEPQLQLYDAWFNGDEPWVLGESDQRQLLRKLEQTFPRLEECHGIRVGIGVATGNDSVYILSRTQAAELESDRVLPLVKRQDLCGAGVKDGGHYVINTFNANGRPISLSDHPRLRSYLLKHEAELRKRHVAKRCEEAWFRTIDRVYPELQGKSKLLIPDIAGVLQVAYDPGGYYPHHNLYFVTSDGPGGIDLEVLGGLLSSKVALFFVWSYAVKMRGGYLRFQAQYLRRIRIPRFESLSQPLQHDIRAAFRQRDFASLDQLAQVAFGLDRLPRFGFDDTRK